MILWSIQPGCCLASGIWISENKIIRFGQAELDQPQIALITDSTGVMNLKWYLDMFGKD